MGKKKENTTWLLNFDNTVFFSKFEFDFRTNFSASFACF